MTESFTYGSSDGSLSSNLATVTLTVDPINDAPVAENDAYSATVNVLDYNIARAALGTRL
ncbi:MAG TPA: Ig-like domain-containing protein [Gemmataceae bacterium]|nr:Ig-like domain-containing protein [Gemmataceae bacterium]